MADPEDADILDGGLGGLAPDHPLLARAQAVLKDQLLSNRQRLEEEVREKKNSVAVSSRDNKLCCMRAS